jgi:proteasome lid subunit RPN8/RPN11
LSTPFRLLLPPAFLEGMIAQAQAEQPLECCGLLAGRIEETANRGRIGRVVGRYPLVNAARSPVRYLSEPESMFAAMRDMHRLGLDVLVVYHSHPTSPPVPSMTDREQNYSPEVIHLIISLQGDTPEVRGWWLTEESYREAEWDTK